MMTPIIRLDDVKVAHSVRGGLLHVLSIPEWTLDPGLQVALVGPSGSGKTTFLHVLSGLLTPNEGGVEVCGHRLDRLPEFDLDRFRALHVGYIFQAFNLLQGYTALENVLLGLSFSRQNTGREHAESLLERVGLADRMGHHPSQLSIGEQQRVAVARALAKEPELILADEPTGSLDPANSRAVADLLQEMCSEGQRTLVVVSHDRELANGFDKVIHFTDLNKAFQPAERCR